MQWNPESGAVEVVRYEVKALPEAGIRTKIRVFLSPNELAVYRRVVRNGSEEPDNPRYRGPWLLIGVEPNGRAVDVTDFLSPLLDEAKAPSLRLDRTALNRMGSCYQSAEAVQTVKTGLVNNQNRYERTITDVDLHQIRVLQCRLRAPVAP